MNIEEIKAAIKANEREMKELAEKNAALKQELLNAISAASEFRPGDRVTVTRGDKIELGIFGGYRMKYEGIEPVVYKVKKDGTPSQFEHWIFHSTKIEKA